MVVTSSAIAQTDSTQLDGNNKIFIIITNSGGEFVGRILKQDPKEILISTQDRGEVIIPKYEVKEIREAKPGDLSTSGKFIPEQLFSTRYFINTNGLPIKKGDSYMIFNLWGPDFQFGVGENLGIGVMTSWVGIPIIGSLKYSIELGENLNMGLGTLLGTGSWAAPEFGLALPFGALTLGTSKNNINFTAGYGVVWSNGKSEGKTLLSVAGLKRISRNASFVVDSFIVPNPGGGDFNVSTIALITPGLRLQFKDNSAFQFGFAAIYAENELIPAPIPFVQWFKKF
ncbi:hypothetical protein [Marinoscillum sp. MHG1-6]|uniref:hypothetical protein n=1 Tax=Marinoscillum sp. MHG1-6 TaxID=2959627 RepID=UPI00215830BF|nr:hypothetical protein [Marinoscillum sp. MHG1-6]